MNLQKHRRRHVARALHRAAKAKAQQEYSEFMHAQAGHFDGMDDDDPWNRADATCEHCSGTGGDPWNDGITPCEVCDGEGYAWWK